MYQRILVPIDGSSTSLRGLEEATTLAKLTGGALHIIHVVDDFSVATGYESYAVYTGDLLPLLHAGGEAILADAKTRVQATGVKADTVLLETLGGRVSDLVIEQAKSVRADLIVIGTHGRRGLSRLLLGSDAEQIVRTSPVPVLLVRAVATDLATAVPIVKPAVEPLPV
jgi:nucleotide-binding universal stress UspA family protein